jgi:hypothetical protein
VDELGLQLAVVGLSSRDLGVELEPI